MDRQVGSFRALGACVAIACCLAMSCFYDSRWGESKRLQEAAARRATPKELRSGGELDQPPPGVGLRVKRIHAYATARHAAEVVDWARQLAARVDDANLVLGPALNIRLEVTQAKLWAASTDDQDLPTLLEELAAHDAGDGVDWVVGLVGSVPRAELSFHELGLATLRGKLLVMRAMNDAREYESIRKELSELDEAERAKLYAARKRHKATAVFLHELAHTFGVMHQPDITTIMNPRYNIKAERFSDSAVEWMKTVLARAGNPELPGEPRLEEALISLLRRTSDTWVPAERDAMMARLQAMSSPPPKAVAAPTAVAASADATPAAPAPAAEASPTATLSAADQVLFAELEKEEKGGKPAAIFKRATPLFSRYPEVYAVQDLRCRLAMRLDAKWDTVQAECAPMMRLGGLTALPK